jgi:Bacterial SH3 domain/N-acetylmuramoyl-L-alanine amidase
MPLAKFYIYSQQYFQKYITDTHFTREITMIQNHHTWEPNYSSITPATGEIYALESMRNFHIKERGWSDIGQNITTFPSGNIGVCRPIDITPAGIFGANQGAICIENLGNFDEGCDVMTERQKDIIVFLNALLCVKFNLTPVKEQVVYHHWFDKSGQRFSDEKINDNLVGDEQKTCPGTAFFGSNTIASAEANFYPLIGSKMTALKKVVAPQPLVKKVNTLANVRNGPGLTFTVLRTAATGTQVTVFASQNGWSKISDTAEEWISGVLLS